MLALPCRQMTPAERTSAPQEPEQRYLLFTVLPVCSALLTRCAVIITDLSHKQVVLLRLYSGRSAAQPAMDA